MKKTPTSYEESQALIAVDMLLYCSSFYYVLTHLNEELHKEGKLKGQTKYIINNLLTRAERVSEFTENRVFGKVKKELSDHYIERAYEIFEDVMTKANSFGKSKMRQIKEGVKPLSGSERYYQLCCSLSLLIEEKNRSLEDTFYYEKAVRLYGFTDKLKILGYTFNEKVLEMVRKIPTGAQIRN